MQPLLNYWPFYRYYDNRDTLYQCMWRRLGGFHYLLDSLFTTDGWRVGKLIWLKIVKSCEFEWWNLARDLKLSDIDTLPPLSFSFIYEYAFNEWMKSSKCVQMSTLIDLRVPYILTFWWGNSLLPSSDADPILLAFTIMMTMINRAIVCVFVREWLY